MVTNIRREQLRQSYILVQVILTSSLGDTPNAVAQLTQARSPNDLTNPVIHVQLLNCRAPVNDVECSGHCCWVPDELPAGQ
jgi:hypothetical protein